MKLIKNGDVFNLLTVVRPASKRGKSKQLFWECKCMCGNITVVCSFDLRNNRTKSCGCLRLKHGHYNSPANVSWRSMCSRCTNPNSGNWEHYGGAPIPVFVCPEWSTFKNFLVDMGERPKGTTLGRVLDIGNYEPGNVFWMTKEEQELSARNKEALLKWKGVQ
jgi:hypothetical protein